MKYTKTQSVIKLLALIFWLWMLAEVLLSLLLDSSVLFIGVFAVIFSLLGFKSWNREVRKQETKTDNSSTQARGMPFLIKGLLKLLLSPINDQDNVIGDLLEEYLQFNTNFQAYVWLYKQVIKSICPLIYKIVRSRLATLFGERVH